ncbi:Uncharacterised protein [Salmonella enterica subsp. enterica]|uniref:Uncharacterized protein n=1 Tax=Salmonella enterica I TaxID=59201 RepID=A0A3S4IM88_SALET|nr:Uncharacterised protein [Salmonella enterica subsp. enterica]
MPWNTYRQPGAGIGAGGFSVEIFQLIGQVARGALELIQHASRIEQNLPQRKVIDDLIVVIHFIADIVNFILEIVFIRNLDADRRKDNSDIVFRFGFLPVTPDLIVLRCHNSRTQRPSRPLASLRASVQVLAALACFAIKSETAIAISESLTFLFTVSPSYYQVK